MSIIAIDIDSTLYDFETPFRQAFLDLALESGVKEYFRGGYQSWVEWRSPTDVCGLDAFNQALDLVHSPDVILTRQPYDHCQEVLDILHDAGHSLMYVSNRKAEVEQPTLDWLLFHNFPEGELVCTVDDKLIHMSECQYLIDDRPKTLVEFVYSRHWGGPPRKAFGLLFEYNRALTDIPGVYLAPTWAGIRYYLSEKGVLNGN